MVHGVVVHKVSDLRRKVWRDRSEPREWVPDTVDQAAVSAEQAALRQEQTSALCALLGVLSEGHRTVLWLRLGLGLSAGEVAVELGCSAISSRLARPSEPG